ncbi:L,D-transpeptidase family protein [Dellaglioa sp. L3N]
MRKSLKIGISIGSILVLGILGGASFNQSTHFNKGITINGTDVSGLSVDKVIGKLKTETSKNDIYVGKTKIIDAKDTATGFTDKDTAAIKTLLKKQRTILPSSAKKNYAIVPQKLDTTIRAQLKSQLKTKLTELNKTRTAAVDANPVLQDGKVSVIPAKKGNQYDVKAILAAYDKTGYSSVTKLKETELQPLSADSATVKADTKKLDTLAASQTVYTVQSTKYTLKGSDILTKVTVKDGNYVVNTSGISAKVAEINKKQATLNKQYSFKTATGGTVSVSGQSYGWALGTNDSVKHILTALEDGTAAIDATNDKYGVGYNTYGTGYETTTNGGIGDTYAEVSIAQQRVWIHKNGKVVLTTDVVTGKHNTGEDTTKGVWYIMYKETPSILKGSEVGKSNYSVKVNNWAQFTNSGIGFHDASWRTNWSKTAYLADGSGGCVNTKPSDMLTLFANVSQNEPVVVY